MSNNSDAKTILPRPLRTGELIAYLKISDIYDFSECLGDDTTTAEDTRMEAPIITVPTSVKKNTKKRSFAQISSTTAPSS